MRCDVGSGSNNVERIFNVATRCCSLATLPLSLLLLLSLLSLSLSMSLATCGNMQQQQQQLLQAAHFYDICDTMRCDHILRTLLAAGFVAGFLSLLLLSRKPTRPPSTHATSPSLSECLCLFRCLACAFVFHFINVRPQFASFMSSFHVFLLVFASCPSASLRIPFSLLSVLALQLSLD